MDKSICTFYQKIGACRHGEKCSRKHVKPSESKTVLLANLYQNPKVSTNENESMSEKQVAEAFSHFFTDIFTKMASVGEVDSIVVCENENFHLSGNVYVRFRTAQSAYNAVMVLNQEWFGGRPVYCELSPVTSFQEANCRAHDTNSCTRGDHCNFMHVIRPREELRTRLAQAQDKLVALRKIRAVKGDETWGQQWEQPTTKSFEREESQKLPVAGSSAGSSVEASAEVSAGSSAEVSAEVSADASADASSLVTEEVTEVPKESKVDAVAKLFGST